MIESDFSLVQLDDRLGVVATVGVSMFVPHGEAREIGGRR